MSNFQAINANNIQLGQDTGVCKIKPQISGNRIKSQMDLVDSNGSNVIDYDQSTNTIDFNNKTVTGFTGGGGGGGGDAFLANTQTFSGVNTFSANTVLTTADIGTITASGNITGASAVVSGNLQANSAVITGDCSITTGNLDVSSGNTTIGGTLTTTGLVACNAGVNITSGNVSMNNGGQTLHADTLLSNGNVTCGAGSTFNVGAAQIASTNLSDTANLLRTTDTAITLTGALVANSVDSAGGIYTFKGVGNSRLEDDANNDVRLQANANTNNIVARLGITGADNLRLSYDSTTQKSVLQLYDFGATPPQYYNVGQNPADFTTLTTALQASSLIFTNTQQFDGSLISNGTVLLNGVAIQIGAGTNQATIQLMNDPNDTTNVTQGVMSFDSAARLTKAGRASGALDLFTSVDTCLDRSAPTWIPTLFTLVSTAPASGEIQLDGTVVNHVQSSIQAVQFGLNGSTPVYKVTCRGRLTGFTVANVGAGSGSISLFTLPVGYRPTVEQNYIAQGHPDEKQVRIDISTAGLVSIAEGASTNNASFCNLGTISFWAGI